MMSSMAKNVTGMGSRPSAGSTINEAEKEKLRRKLLEQEGLADLMRGAQQK